MKNVKFQTKFYNMLIKFFKLNQICNLSLFHEYWFYHYFEKINEKNEKFIQEILKTNNNVLKYTKYQKCLFITYADFLVPSRHFLQW